MVNEPKVLLADEPTGALDSKAGLAVMELFEALNREGVTIVMITHEAEIAECAKRIIMLRDGQIVQERSGRGSVPKQEASHEEE